MKKWLGALTLGLTVAVAPVASASTIDITQEYNKTGQYIIQSMPEAKYGSEWYVLGLARGDYAVPAGYFQKYYQDIERVVAEKKGILNPRNPIDNAKMALVVSAIAKDPTNVAGYNLLAPLKDYATVTKTGVMGAIYALLAVNAKDLTFPTGGTNSEQRMIEAILNKQTADGGFNLTTAGGKGDVDITAMALQALAPYSNDETVAPAIAKAQQFIKGKKLADGAFPDYFGNPTSESASQVVTMLGEYGINPQTDSEFSDVLTSLLTYRATDGGFKHVMMEKGANGMATSQANYALAAMKRVNDNKTSLYDMSDTAYQFIDLFGHWVHPYAMESKEKGIIGGYADGTFRAGKNLTRAQAASILTRMLDLKPTSATAFPDISHLDKKTQQEIIAAADAGIIKGDLQGNFNPGKNITRAQLSVMLHRTYHEQKQPYQPSELAPLKDISQLDREKQEAITMVYDFGIAQGVNGMFSPANPTTRGQAAKMFSLFDEQLQN